MDGPAVEPWWVCGEAYAARILIPPRLRSSPVTQRRHSGTLSGSLPPVLRYHSFRFRALSLSWTWFLSLRTSESLPPRPWRERICDQKGPPTRLRPVRSACSSSLDHVCREYDTGAADGVRARLALAGEDAQSLPGLRLGDPERPERSG